MKQPRHGKYSSLNEHHLWKINIFLWPNVQATLHDQKYVNIQTLRPYVMIEHVTLTPWELMCSNSLHSPGFSLSTEFDVGWGGGLCAQGYHHVKTGQDTKLEEHIMVHCRFNSELRGLEPTWKNQSTPERYSSSTELHSWHRAFRQAALSW